MHNGLFQGHFIWTKILKTHFFQILEHYVFQKGHKSTFFFVSFYPVTFNSGYIMANKNMTCICSDFFKLFFSRSGRF